MPRKRARLGPGFRIRGRQPPPPLKPPTPPPPPGEEPDDGRHVEPSPDRPDLYPERWVYNDEQPRLWRRSPEQAVAKGIRDHIDGQSIRIGFQLTGEVARPNPNYEFFDGAIQMGARMFKTTLLRRLDAGESLRTIIARVLGIQPANITNVVEVSLAESVYG